VAGADQVFQGKDARVAPGPWDVIVVGAGIYGLPTAYYLARHHKAQVLVVEDNTIPGECITVNTGGIIRIAYSDLDVVRVAAFAREIYRNPTERLGVPRPVHLGFVPTGWGRFVNEDAAPGILAEVTRIARGAGGRLEWCRCASTSPRCRPAAAETSSGSWRWRTRPTCSRTPTAASPMAAPRSPDSTGLNLGRSPRDIAGGAYYMNPEELPFEGVVPGTGSTVFYAGSGCGTGFKLGPGVAWLLAERLADVPRARRLIASAALSAERATYFYPPGTSREELLRQFRPAAEGGRLIEMGAAGIAISRGWLSS
jgi:glycine/D-amino acid oxidase-like deaminating enzyme